MEDKRKQLTEIMMDNPKITAAEWLETQPEAFRPLLMEGLYRCMEKRWPLYEASIYPAAREIDAERHPKGW